MFIIEKTYLTDNWKWTWCFFTFGMLWRRALTSGTGVAIALLLGAAGPLIGVAISASLLPPVVNCVSISQIEIIESHLTLFGYKFGLREMNEQDVLFTRCLPWNDTSILEFCWHLSNCYFRLFASDALRCYRKCVMIFHSILPQSNHFLQSSLSNNLFQAELNLLSCAVLCQAVLFWICIKHYISFDNPISGIDTLLF